MVYLNLGSEYGLLSDHLMSLIVGRHKMAGGSPLCTKDKVLITDELMANILAN